MRYFLLGLAGGSLVLVGFFIVISQYSDYQARAETDGWIVQVRSIQDTVAQTAVKQKTLLGVDKLVDRGAFRGEHVDVFEIMESGVIIARGGREGQVIVLIPSLIGETITWRCIGGPARAMPSKCRNGST